MTHEHKQKLDKTIQFLERTRERWLQAGAGYEVLSEIDARIADLREVLAEQLAPRRE